MSVLNRLRPSTWRTPIDQTPSYTPTPQERLNEAAADRGYAFGLIEDAEQALTEARDNEEVAAAELLKIAEATAEMTDIAYQRQIEEALEASRRGHQRAQEKAELATQAQGRADADASLLAVLSNYLDSEEDEVVERVEGGTA